MRLVSLKNKMEFDRVFDEGARFNGKLMTVIIAGTAGPSKLGVIVNSKFGGAVARNRLKRQVREAFGSIAANFIDNAETIVIPRGSAKKVKTREILSDLSSIAHRAGIL
jgi:ribonuclease P protein component